jgi:hypothetical protein
MGHPVKRLSTARGLPLASADCSLLTAHLASDPEPACVATPPGAFLDIH